LIFLLEDNKLLICELNSIGGIVQNEIACNADISNLIVQAAIDKFRKFVVMEIPDNLIKSIAIQFYINRNREMDTSLPTYHATNNVVDRNWRDEVVKWKALNEDERKVLLDASRKYLVRLV